MKKRTASFLLLIVLLLSSAAAWASAVSTARETLWRALLSGEGSGATVAIMDQGKLIYSEGLGVADRAENRPVSARTRFNIGSTSKMFAAVAVLLLVDEGRIDLDRPVATYLPEFVMADERYREITVRMLFNHASGLPGSTFAFSYGNGSDPHALLLETLRELHLKHDPGALSIYCNDGFTLAEMIVERVSGASFLDFLRSRVFAPLAMTDTGPSVGEGPDQGQAARCYDDRGVKYPLERVSVYGAGGLASTAEDLCRFGDSFTQGGHRILSEASIEEILKVQPTRLFDALQGPQMMNAFGWDYCDLPAYQAIGVQVLAKSGGTACYSTQLVVLPRQRIVLALSLSGRASVEALSRPILDALMRERGLPAPDEKKATKPPLPEPIPREMRARAGYYTDGNDFLRLDIDEAGLMAFHLLGEAEEAPTLSLIHNGGRLHSEKRGSFYFFDEVGATCLVNSLPSDFYGTDVIAFQRIEPLSSPVSLAVDMEERRWFLRNATPSMEIFDDSLICRSSLHRELPGYVDFCGPKRIEDGRFAAMAATAFRDQTELRLIGEGDQLRLKAAQFLFSSDEGFRRLLPGTNRLAIGEAGENEWLKISVGSLLSFSSPGGRVLLVTGEGALLYDDLVDDGEVYAPEGSYLFFAGAPGEVLLVRAR